MLQLALAVSIAWSLLGAIPPLSPEQQQRLSAVSDGPDERDDAFSALVENAAQWTAGVGDTPIRLKPDMAAILARPQIYRGDVCRIQGKIQQRTPLQLPHESVGEWFVRGNDKQPVLVYVARLDQAAVFEDGQDIEIDARFYKLVDAVARDGTSHRYPAFVGTSPRLKPAPVASPVGENGLSQLWMIAGPVAAMSLAFAVLLILIRRKSSASRRESAWLWRHATGIDAFDARNEVDGDAPLPDDPAEALAELQRRARTLPPIS